MVAVYFSLVSNKVGKYQTVADVPEMWREGVQKMFDELDDTF